MSLLTRIFLIGPMGAGKTSVGMELAKQLGFEFLDSDIIIKNRSGLSITDIFQKFGVDFFRTQETAILQEVAQKNHLVFATGGGAIVSATNRRLLNSGLVCYLRVNPLQQQQRLQCCNDHPLLPQDRTLWLQCLDQLAQQRSSLYNEIADIVLDTDHITVSETTQLLRAILEDKYAYA